VMPCGWENNRKPGGKQWQPTAGWMTYSQLRADCLYCVHRDQLRAQRSVTSMRSIYLLPFKEYLWNG